MKKLITVILSMLLFTVLAISGSAVVITPDEGYTAYPLLCNENVRFVAFDEEGNETELEVPDPLDITNGMTIGDNGELQLWFPLGANHLSEFKLLSNYSALLSQGIAALDSMYTEITFTGTAIKLGTCYRNIPAELGTSSAAKVEIDGTEYPCVANALKTENANDTTPTIFFEVSGLEDKEHTVRVYNAEENFSGTRLNWDFYEIIGTDPETSGYGAAEKPADTQVTTEDNTTTAGDTSSKPADSNTDSLVTTSGVTTGTPDTGDTTEKDGGFPIWILIVIVAAVVVVVVAVVVKKKKK